MVAQASMVIGEYILHEKLGEGGMGAVYRAVNRLSGQHVALKRVHLTAISIPDSSLGDNDTHRDGGVPNKSIGSRTVLAQEFQTLASLHHPHIVGVRDYGFDSQQSPYYTMDLLDSPQTITEAAEGGDVELKVELLVQLLQALAYLHRRNILHRDIKPSNVMVLHGQVKLVDFGIAGTIGAGDKLAGTIQYMAPELFLGAPSSIASDLFAVGVVASEMLRQQMPKETISTTRFLANLLGEDEGSTLAPDAAELLVGLGNSSQEVTEAEEVVANLDLGEGSQRLTAIVKRLLERNPADRYSDAAEVIRDLSDAIGQPLPLETAATRESFLQAAEFVGREEELALLDAALAEAQNQQGSVWLLAGESGVGKTRLANELRIRALVRFGRVVRNQGSTERAANYGLWVPIIRALCLDANLEEEHIEVLSDIVPDIATLLQRRVGAPARLPPQAAQTRLHHAVAALLRKQRQLVVIFLADLQWAGSESLALLSYLAPLVRELPVLIVGDYRDDEASEELRKLAGARHLRLERLAFKQIAQLCESMLGPNGRRPELVDYLAKHTEGNVFFIVETVRALAQRAGRLDQVTTEKLPENILTGGIELIIQRRISQIPAEFVELLNLVAVAGRRLDLGLIERASERRDLAPFLLACADASVLEVQRGEWQFSHDKLREWLLRHLSEADGRRLHRQVAESITLLYPDDPSQDATLGYHWDKANSPEKAYDYYIKAGAAAARLYANVEARAHYSAALAIIDRQEPSLHNQRRMIDTLLIVIGLSIYTSSLPDLLTRLEQVESYARELLTGDGVLHEDILRDMRIQFWKGRCSLLLGAVVPAIQHCQRACVLAKTHDAQEVYAAACLMIGQSKFTQGHMGACWPYLQDALAWLEPRAPSPDWIRVVGFQGLSLLARGEVSAGREYIDKLWGPAKTLNLLATVYTYAAVGALLLHDWVALKEAAQQMLVQAEQGKDRRLAANSLWLLARAEGELGNLDAAARHSENAQSFFTKKVNNILQDWFSVADAETIMQMGRPARAIEIVEQAIELARSMGSIFGQGLGHRTWARALALLPEPNWPEIEAHLAQSVGLFELGEAWLELAHTQVAIAELATQRGEVQSASRHFAMAIQRYESAQLVPALTEARSSLERLYAAKTG